MELIELIDSTILSGQEAWEKLEELVKGGPWTTCAVIVDENTSQFCLPELKELLPSIDFVVIQIPSGEKHKTLSTCNSIWKDMIHHSLDRKSLCFNLGGGVIGDMGGFCASTYMRGIDFIQIPTTLLSMVDASVGSKLGVDFEGYKNMIGMFNDPDLVMIHPKFLKTLSGGELRSGYAEMLKHVLIGDVEAWEQYITAYNWRDNVNESNILSSVRIKKRFVEQDPYEQGIRKALNYGHTFGHAIESLGLDSDDFVSLKHGEAVALGMVFANIIAHEKDMLGRTEMEQINNYIFSVYKPVKVPKRFWETIFAYIVKDKKNKKGKILMTLLEEIGDVKVNIEVSPEEIFFAISAYNALVASTKKSKSGS
jgi:3-dehydroquinate synthase